MIAGKSTVCLLAKDEQRAIAEWIAYYINIGFDRIEIYDNESTDETSKIIQSIMSVEKTVFYHKWPDRNDERPQFAAYKHALENCKTEWIAFFDTDEFLVLHTHSSINAFLDEMPEDVGGIAFNWLIFGSNDRVEAGEGLVIERFQKCARIQHAKNKFIKSIVRPSKVCQMLVHNAILAEGRYINASKSNVEIDNNCKVHDFSYDIAQLNHYAVKSQEEFALKKRRGSSARAPNEVDKFSHIDRSAGFWEAHDANDASDTKILRFKSAIEQRINKWFI